MKLINPSVEFIRQGEGLIGVAKVIEAAGRTCYKSEHLITDDSANKFVERMINLSHCAMLEHGTVYLEIPFVTLIDKNDAINFYKQNPYSFITECPYESLFYITTNLRVIEENNRWEDLSNFICDSSEKHIKRYTVKVTMDRAGSQSFVRHRVMSFAQESTRYCNYSKSKFSGEISISTPVWLMDRPEIEKIGELDLLDLFLNCNFSSQATDLNYWELANRTAEFCYMNLIEKGWTAEKARSVLPADLKTELVMTATMDQFNEFFKLRIDKHAHPDAQYVASLIKDEIIKNI